MTNSVLLIPVVTSPVFIIIGLIMLKFPPKKINALYGYRTSSSMKDQERWDFAQIYSAKEMIKLGGLLMLSSLIGLFCNPKESIAIILGVGLLPIMVVFLLIRVERAIKNKFKTNVDQRLNH